MRVTWTAALLLCLLSAAVATAANDSAMPPSAVPRSLGHKSETLRISAATLIRWQRGRTTLLDLQGNATLYQGDSSLRAVRLLIWFQESEQAGEKGAVIEAYGEKGMALREDGKESVTDGPMIVRMAASAGLVLRGRETLAGDPLVFDPFRVRAFVLHGDAVESAAEGAAGGLFSEFSPSGERMGVSDLTDAGATVTLSGNAEIVSDNLTLAADVLRVRISFRDGRYKSPRVQSVYAEGSVDLRRGNLRITSDALYVDWATNQGLAVGARVRMRDPRGNIPVQFAAGAIREQSLYRFTTEGTGYFTTSELAEPFYRVESARIQAVRGPEPPAAPQPESSPPAGQPRESLVVSASDLTLRAGSVPLFYWPYIAEDLRGGAFLIKAVEIGNDSALGSFLKLQWNLNDLGILRNDWSDLTLRTDAYSSRGLGLGLDFNYKTAARHGYARAYYIHDYAKTDENDFPAPRNDNRGELTFRDREDLGAGWQADAELGYLSDRHYLLTYDRKSLDEDQDRETQVFLSHFSQNSLLTVQARTRLNDFQNQVERESVAYHDVGTHVLDSPLLWTTHTDLSRLQLRYDKGLALRDPDPVGRLDSANEVSYPAQLGVIRAEPFLWGDLTGYSTGADDESSSLRAATAYGVRASANFYRTFDTRSDFFEIDRLRHILTPSVEYLNRWYVSRDPSHYIQNDEIDALDEAHLVTLGLRSRLQTYRDTDTGRKLVELLLADVKYHWFLRKQDTFPNTGDYAEATLCWLMTEDIELTSVDNRFNTQKGRVDAANGELTLNYWRPIQFSLIYKYFVDPTVTAGPRHSVGLIHVGYQPLHSRWRVDLTTSYDFLAERQPGETRNPHALGTGPYFTRNMDGWDLSIGAEFNQGLVNETVFMFRVSPPGSQPQFRTGRNPFRHSTQLTKIAMSKAMFRGTFDPVTLGHLDVIARAARIFDRLIVAVGENPEKKSLFSRKERAAMIRHEIGRLRNVEVMTFRGLMADFARTENVSVILRGIRTVSDLEYEIQMAFTNRASAGVETVFIAPQPEHAFIRTRFIKEIAAGGGRVHGMVSPAVEARLRERLAAARPGRKPETLEMTLRALLIGDVVGNPGRDILTAKLAALRQKRQVDVCIANVENASGGSGLTPENGRQILAAGVDVMTMGDHVWKRKEIVPYMESEPRLLRPHNFSPLAAGTGLGVYTLASGVRIAVLDLLGRVFMKPVDDPFRCADEALRKLAAETPNIFVDFHAEATAEKIAMGCHLDGRVTCVFGTHTHVQTADERVLPKGSAFLCDLGMTGPYDSILGRRTDRVLQATLTQMPVPFDVAKGDVRISGALVTFDPRSGRALAIERLQLREDQEP